MEAQIKIQNENQFIEKVSKRFLQYEPLRKKKVWEMVQGEIILLILVLVLFMATHYCSIFILFLISFVILLFTNPGSCNKEFKRTMKVVCKKNICETFGINTMNGTEIHETLLRASNLFSEFNIYEYDDIIEGNYNGVQYRITELELSRESGSRYRMTFEAFKGVVIDLPTNKPIKAHTIITTKGDKNIRNSIPINTYKFVLPMLLVIPLIPVLFIMRANIIINSLIQFFFIIGLITAIVIIGIYKRKQMEKSKLEDTIFEKKYDVYSEDQIEARYLITPSFMERMNNLQTAFGTENIKCAFFADKIIFAIYTKKDLFEICDLYTKMENNSRIKQFCKEIKSIQDMIDYFKLAERTGL